MHDERLANLLGAAALTVAERMTSAAARAAGVSVSGAAALVTLAETGESAGRGAIGVTELGRRIGLSQPACARMLDQLAASGLVVRTPGGGRNVALHLTEEGTAAAGRARRARGEELREVLAGLAPGQRAVLTDALEPLLARLYGQVGSEDVVCRLCDRGSCLAAGHVCPVGRAAREARAARAAPATRKGRGGDG